MDIRIWVKRPVLNSVYFVNWSAHSIKLNEGNVTTHPGSILTYVHFRRGNHRLIWHALARLATENLTAKQGSICLKTHLHIQISGGHIYLFFYKVFSNVQTGRRNKQFKKNQGIYFKYEYPVK